MRVIFLFIDHCSFNRHTVVLPYHHLDVVYVHEHHDKDKGVMCHLLHCGTSVSRREVHNDLNYDINAYWKNKKPLSSVFYLKVEVFYWLWQ